MQHTQLLFLLIFAHIPPSPSHSHSTSLALGRLAHLHSLHFSHFLSLSSSVPPFNPRNLAVLLSAHHSPPALTSP
ncbi:hypothetical protein EDD21DRAFT_234948 [Dissophora ornata]|nr:hypothetical protein EDD21DRAFT_234948 [Dissophora ornata]